MKAQAESLSALPYSLPGGERGRARRGMLGRQVKGRGNRGEAGETWLSEGLQGVVISLAGF